MKTARTQKQFLLRGFKCCANRVFIFIFYYLQKFNATNNFHTICKKTQHTQFAFVSSVSLIPEYLSFLFHLTTTATTATIKTRIILYFCFFFGCISCRCRFYYYSYCCCCCVALRYVGSR